VRKAHLAGSQRRHRDVACRVEHVCVPGHGLKSVLDCVGVTTRKWDRPEDLDPAGRGARSAVRARRPTAAVADAARAARLPGPTWWSGSRGESRRRRAAGAGTVRMLVEARERIAERFPLRRVERAQEVLADGGCVDWASLGYPGSSGVCHAYLDTPFAERSSRYEPALFHPGEVVRETASMPAQRLCQLALAEGSLPDLDHAGEHAEVGVGESSRGKDIDGYVCADTLRRLLPPRPERRLLCCEVRHPLILRGAVDVAT
jgi:hypothetical protein